jgi:cytochrome o ubiquinol oxidase subunit IV
MNDIHNINSHPGWQPHPGWGAPGDHDGYRKDLSSYVSGLVLALILTAVPFALVYWHAMTTASLLLAIGIFALVQAMVHFRFFLHVDPRRNVDELLLVLFSTTILVMMAGGTVWILGNLHLRMY